MLPIYFFRSYQIILLQIKAMETCVICKKILQTKLLVLEKLNKMDEFVSDYVVCSQDKSRFIENPEASRLKFD